MIYIYLSSILAFKTKLMLNVNRKQPSPTKSFSVIPSKHLTNIFPPCFLLGLLLILCDLLFFTISRLQGPLLLQLVNCGFVFNDAADLIAEHNNHKQTKQDSCKKAYSRNNYCTCIYEQCAVCIQTHCTLIAN